MNSNYDKNYKPDSWSATERRVPYIRPIQDVLIQMGLNKTTNRPSNSNTNDSASKQWQPCTLCGKIPPTKK